MDHSVYEPSGIYTFRIRGELVHRIDSLLPLVGQQPRFSQIYIFDSDPHPQADARMSYHHGLLNRSLILQLQHMLQIHNPYIYVFRTAKEWLNITENISLCLKMINTESLDHRQYN